LRGQREQRSLAPRFGSKVEQHRGTIATNVTASSLAKETRGFLAVDANRTCSDRRGKNDEYRDCMPESVSKVCTLEPILSELKAMDFTYFHFLSHFYFFLFFFYYFLFWNLELGLYMILQSYCHTLVTVT